MWRYIAKSANGITSTRTARIHTELWTLRTHTHRHPHTKPSRTRPRQIGAENPLLVRVLART